MTTRMHTRPPMDAIEAYSVIAEMVEQRAPKNTQRRLLSIALGPLGNLDKGATAVYKMRLAQLSEHAK